MSLAGWGRNPETHRELVSRPSRLEDRTDSHWNQGGTWEMSLAGWGRNPETHRELASRPSRFENRTDPQWNLRGTRRLSRARRCRSQKTQFLRCRQDLYLVRAHHHPHPCLYPHLPLVDFQGRTPFAPGENR
jgi:predicted metalloprotease